MTITNRKMNSRLSNLERCAEMAPVGTYERAKDAVDAIHDLSTIILTTLRASGFKALNDDRLRDLENHIYDYLLKSNPQEYQIAAAEGFGEYVDDPVVGRRILEQASANRDFLAAMGKV